MYKLLLDDIEFVDGLEGISEFSRSIIRDWSDASLDNILREKTEASLSFAGDAFCYLYDKGADKCAAVNVKVFKEDDTLFFEGTIYPFMIEYDYERRIATTQLKDNNWSAFLADKANREVNIRNTFTLSCEPITPVLRRLVIFEDIDNNEYTGRRIGFDVFDILSYIVNYFTNGAFTLISPYLQSLKLAIFTEQAMKINTVTLPGFVLLEREEIVTPLVSFEQVFTEVRKKYPIKMVVNGSTIEIKADADTFKNSPILGSFTDAPYDLNITTDDDRSFTTIEVGSKDTKLEDDDFLTFPNNRFLDWQEVKFNTCSCENNKDNSLDLVSDFVIDSNVIYETLAQPFEPTGSRIFMVEYDDEAIPGATIAKRKINPSTNIGHYNDNLRNDVVLERWRTFATNCFTSIGNLNINFNLECDPITDPFNCTVAPAAGNTPRQVLGYMNFPPPFPPDPLSDSEGTFPVITGLPTDFIPGGSNGYGINIPGFYIFQARGSWGLTVASNVDIAQVTISIVAYSDYSCTTEIYRKDETQTFTNTGSIGAVQLDILSDFVHLDAGACVVVEMSSFVDNSTPVNVQQTFGRTFWRIPEQELECFELDDEVKNYPYVYKFPSSCNDIDYLQALANKEGKFVIKGVDCWISEITENLTGGVDVTLLSNELIPL